MNVLFLDIDGVMNSEEYYYALPEAEMLAVPIDPACVKRLKYIVDRTGAKIVLSSSWRTGWDKDPARMKEDGRILEKIFSEYDLTIYDKTPVSPLRKRTVEIDMWLKKHAGKVKRYVILDDCDYDWKDYGMGRHWVATDFAKSGLTDQKAEEVISLFTKSFLYFLPERLFRKH